MGEPQRIGDDWREHTLRDIGIDAQAQRHSRRVHLELDVACAWSRSDDRVRDGGGIRRSRAWVDLRARDRQQGLDDALHLAAILNDALERGPVLRLASVATQRKLALYDQLGKRR